MPLTSREILQAWDRGLGQHPLDRALTLLRLGAVAPEDVDLAAWPVGARDEALLALREATFGRVLGGFARCPACAAPLEFDVDAAAFRAPAGIDVGPFVVEADGLTVSVRQPDSRDLAAVVEHGDDDPESALLHRCVGEARDRAGDARDPWASGRIPAALRERIAQELVARAPLVAADVALTCPACHHAWEVGVDIAGYFWTEIEAEAHRLLGQVAELARAFGWRESDILAMSARRRHAYLQVLGP